MSKLKFSIRRALPDDAAGFCELMSKESVFASLGELPYPTEIDWRERLSKRQNDRDIDLVAVAESEIIGQISLSGNSGVLRRHAGSIAISVIEKAQGQGVGTALMKAMTEYADEWTTIFRLELFVYSDNAKAIALYEKFGFRQEGLLRNFMLRKGRFEDLISMARLQSQSEHQVHHQEQHHAVSSMFE